MKALVRVLVSIYVLGSFGGVLGAKSRRRKAPTRNTQTQLSSPRQAGARKAVKAKLRTFQKIAGTTKKSALTYLPKLSQFVEPVKAKKQGVQSRRVRRRKTTTSKALSRRQQRRTMRVSRIRSNDQAEKIFSWPVDPKNFWLSSPFGPRTIRGKEGFHGGIDMAAPTGTPVYAAAEGKVVESRFSPGYGNYILIAHPNGYKTRYAHLSKSLTKTGQRVEAGKLIGRVGATGHVVKRRASSSGSHLHFEVYKHGSWVDPIGYIR